MSNNNQGNQKQREKERAAAAAQGRTPPALPPPSPAPQDLALDAPPTADGVTPPTDPSGVAEGETDAISEEGIGGGEKDIPASMGVTPPTPPAGTVAEAFVAQLVEERRARTSPRHRADLARGMTLRCNNFEGGLAVLGLVEKVDLANAQAMLWIDHLKRQWPVKFERITGAVWDHVPDDYPPPGEEEWFDANFRAEQVVFNDPTPKVVKPIFTPPRPARAGHLWARAKTPVKAIGFALVDKSERKIVWEQNQWGELAAQAFDPALFEAHTPAS